MSLSQWQMLFNAPVFEQPFASPILTIDWNNGPEQHVILTGATTIAFANILDGMHYVLHIQQDGIGGRVVTWPAAAKFGLVSNVVSIGANVNDMFLGFARGSSMHMVAVKGFL